MERLHKVGAMLDVPVVEVHKSNESTELTL